MGTACEGYKFCIDEVYSERGQLLRDAGGGKQGSDSVRGLRRRGSISPHLETVPVSAYGTGIIESTSLLSKCPSLVTRMAYET